ncbi:MAG: hypothetical protein ACPIOQ_73255, partial [Promethearchaeia archaeon]
LELDVKRGGHVQFQQRLSRSCGRRSSAGQRGMPKSHRNATDKTKQRKMDVRERKIKKLAVLHPLRSPSSYAHRSPQAASVSVHASHAWSARGDRDLRVISRVTHLHTPTRQSQGRKGAQELDPHRFGGQAHQGR